MLDGKSSTRKRGEENLPHDEDGGLGYWGTYAGGYSALRGDGE